MVASSALALAAYAGSPRIDRHDVKFVQKGSFAEITYTLEDAPAIVTMEIQTNTLANGAGEWVPLDGMHVQTVEGDVNGSTNEVTGVSSVLVDAPVKSVAVSDAPADFSTFACGTVFMFR